LSRFFLAKKYASSYIFMDLLSPLGWLNPQPLARMLSYCNERL